MSEQMTSIAPEPAAIEAEPKKRPKWKPSAKARKAKAMRGLIRLNADAPILEQVRSHAFRRW